MKGTRLRLREVRESDGTVIHKLGHKVRLTKGPAEVANTNFYLNDQEWALLCDLPARLLHKRRHMIHRDGFDVVVDEYGDGTLIAESMMETGNRALFPTGSRLCRTSATTRIGPAWSSLERTGQPKPSASSRVGCRGHESGRPPLI